MDNGSQLKNYGILLQNIGMQIKNMSSNYKQIPQNISTQMQNMAIQIFDIGVQIFNIGIQFSNMINQNNNMTNQNMFMGMGNMNFPNMMNQNQFIGMGMNGLEPLENNNFNNSKDKSKENIVNFCFKSSRGLLTNITCKDDITVEELSKLYLNKIGLNYELFEKSKIIFLINGNIITIRHKEKKVRDFYTVFDSNNLITAIESN